MKRGSQIEKFKEWTKIKAGATIRATLVEGIPVQASEESEVEKKDLWLLFISISSNDRWLSYGAVDQLIGEPELSLHNLDIERLKKLSILIGHSWMRLEDAPEVIAQIQRTQVAEVDVVIDEVMAMSYTELIKKREDSDWETTEALWRHRGIKLSLN